MSDIKSKVIEVIKKIYDPEIPVNIYELGLIYDIQVDKDQKIKIMSLSGVKQFPMRVKCATLSWHTLNSAMEGKKEEVNTEVID